MGYSISNGRVRLCVVKECTMRKRVDFANEVFVCMQQKDRVRWKCEGCETRPGGRQEEGSDEAYETNTPKTPKRPKTAQAAGGPEAGSFPLARDWVSEQGRQPARGSPSTMSSGWIAHVPLSFLARLEVLEGSGGQVYGTWAVACVPHSAVRLSGTLDMLN